MCVCGGGETGEREGGGAGGAGVGAGEKGRMEPRMFYAKCPSYFQDNLSKTK